MGPAAIVAQQKKSQQSESAHPDAREIRSDGDHNSVVAMSGVPEGADRRESSAPAQVARRESVSTVPTNTNGTDYTNNTLATSVDESPQHLQNGTTAASSSLATKNIEDGYAVNGVSGTAKTGPPGLNLPKMDGVVAIDMKIPGRYPPTNVAA